MRNQQICRLCISVADPDPRIRMSLGLLDPNPGPVVRSKDLDRDPSIIDQK